MSVKELIQSAQYIVDTDGKQTAIVIDVDSWNRFLSEYTAVNQKQVSQSTTVSAETKLEIQKIVAENETVLKRLAHA